MAKTVELDEAEYNRLTALHGVAARIVADPKARKLLEQAHRVVDPSAPAPMLDAESSVMTPVCAAGL